jgi:uncharacterized C2H2 Zn-finger protein
MTIDRDKSEEPVMCSKCNEVFETDSSYKQHYNEKHKPKEEKEAQNKKFSKSYAIVRRSETHKTHMHFWQSLNYIL